MSTRLDTLLVMSFLAASPAFAQAPAQAPQVHVGDTWKYRTQRRFHSRTGKRIHAAHRGLERAGNRGPNDRHEGQEGLAVLQSRVESAGCRRDSLRPVLSGLQVSVDAGRDLEREICIIYHRRRCILGQRPDTSPCGMRRQFNGSCRGNRSSRATAAYAARVSKSSSNMCLKHRRLMHRRPNDRRQMSK
jgi:hypothetical protein